MSYGKYVMLVGENTLALNRPALNADGWKDKELYSMPVAEAEAMVALVDETLAKTNAGEKALQIGCDLHDFASFYKTSKAAAAETAAAAEAAAAAAATAE